MRAILLLAGLAWLAATGALAAVVPATPATLQAAWTSARPGDTLDLGTGVYGPAVLKARTFAPPLKIKADAATVTEWRFVGVSGIDWTGGTIKNLGGAGKALSIEGGTKPDSTNAGDCWGWRVTGAKVVGPFTATPGQPFVPGQGYGIMVSRCRGVEVSRNSLSGFKVGLLFGQSYDITADANGFSLMAADGINLGQVWGARITNTDCYAMMLLGDNHPDCVQGYSRPFWPNSRTPAPPTSDLVITGTRAAGEMQGVFLGNHVRDYAADKYGPAIPGVDDGGFDRVLIADNDIAMGGGNAIAIGGGRGVVVRNNRIQTLPGAPYLANLNADPVKNPGIVRCGNVVADGGGKRGFSEAAC
jgi:hypothetical protein